MTNPDRELIQLLKDYQSRNRLNNDRMAERLGIHPAHWSKLRREKVHVTRPSILTGFVKLFPRRMGLLRSFLLGESEIDSEEHVA